MKWTRKTKEFDYADYISEDGDLHIRDMAINDRRRYLDHIENGGKKTEYWALLKDEEIIVWGKTVKACKEYAEANR